MPVSAAAVANAISSAPAWALVSLTMPDADLRERGAEELGRWIADCLGPSPVADARQLALPLPLPGNV